MAFDIPLPFELDPDEEERKRREAQALSEAIALEELETGERSPLRDAIPTEPTQGMDQPTADSVIDSVVKQAKDASGLTRSFVAGSVGSAASSVWGLMGGIAGIPTVIQREYGDPGRLSARGTRLPPGPYQDPNLAPEFLIGTGQNLQRRIQEGLGVGTTPVGADYIAQTLGKSAQPTGPAGAAAKAIASALISGVHFGTDWYREYAKRKEGPQPGDLADRDPTREMTVPDWLATALVSPAGAAESMTPDAIKRRFERAEAAKAREQGFTGKMEFVYPDPNTTTIETAGGPATISKAELATMGGLLVSTLGMMFGPKVYNNFKLAPAIPFRPVTNAPQGTYAISNLGDLMRTYDDANAGLLRLAERAGATPDVLKDLQLKFGVQARSAAHAMSDTAIINGHMVTPTFQFTTRAPISKINAVDNPELSRYAHLLDTMDDINMADSTPKAMAAQKAAAQGKAPAPGPTVIRGMTMADVLREKVAMERANPDLRVIHTEYQQFLRDVRKFESDGEYGTISKQEMRDRNSGNSKYAGPNEVPFEGKRQVGDPLDRGLFSEAAATVMRTRIRERLENEAVGLYVDSMIKTSKARNQPALFTRVKDEDLAKNSSWEANVVSFKRRGVTEKYVTDPFLADVLKLDPYYFQSTAANIAFASKRMMEIGATGALAPFFAATSFLRNWQIAKFTTPEGLRSPGLLSSLVAIPRQLDPLLSRAISISLERGSAGWMGRMFGQGNVQALSARLARDYDRSLFAQMQASGTHKGSILEQQQRAAVKLSQAISRMTPGPLRTAWSAYTNMLSAIHNAPSFALTTKNIGRVKSRKDLSELALAARRLTGDPRSAGQAFTPRGRAIRFENKQAGTWGVGGKVDTLAALGYGRLTEVGRSSLPWFNATTQGIKRIGQAYLDNPMKFTGKLWLYQIMPAGIAYMMARHLGKDPNGMSYADYAINRRTDQDRLMNLYIPIPGLPAEHGVKIPRFHEVSLAGMLTESAMDHIFRASNPAFSEKEGFLRAIGSFLDVAIMPPAPPFYTLGLAQQGMVSAGSWLEGNAYKRRTNPYDSTQGVDVKIELTLRAIAGGIGEIVGGGAAAFTQTPAEVESRFGNALKEVGTRMVHKTPVLRDVLGMHPPISGNVPIMAELHKKQRAIEGIVNYYNKWGLLGEKDINVKPVSKSGGALAQQKLEQAGTLAGTQLSPTRPGLAQDIPKNPLYLEGAKMLWQRFKMDAPWTDPKDLPGRDDTVDPRTGKALSQTKQAKARREERRIIAEQRWQAALDEGGGPMGFRSLWKRYGDASEKLRDLQKINKGNVSTWQQRLQARDPENTLRELTLNNVDITNPDAVRNFYERVRLDVGRVILHEIRKVENDLSNKYGQKIKIEDLDPHKVPDWYLQLMISPF